MARVRGLWLILVLAATLVAPGGFVYLNLTLLVAGLIGLPRMVQVWRQLVRNPMATWGLAGLGCIAAGELVVGLHFDYLIDAYEPLIPFVFLPLMVVGVWVLRPALPTLWAGFSLAGVLAAAMAVYQVFLGSQARATGAVGNAIVFGHTAVLLACMALCGFLYFRREGASWIWRALCVAGVAGGALASLLSGSKGGWFALVLMALASPWAVWETAPTKGKLGASACLLLVLIVAVLLLPGEGVRERIADGVTGAWRWFSDGVVTEGSVGIRLEIWRFALANAADHLWFGRHIDEATALLGSHLAQLPYTGLPARFATFENLWVETLMSGGLVGIASLLCAFGCLLLAYLHPSHRDREDLRELRLAGLFLVLCFLGFAMTVHALGINVFRQVLIGWTLLLLASATKTQRP